MALARLKGKIPKEIPFELKRCESCRRAKQGAIVCRVVRAHDGITEPDGGDWAPPAGFREWLAAWKEGDGKSTVRTPTKKPKRPRPPPKPKEEEPERRSNATARQEAARAKAAAYEKIRADEIARTTKVKPPPPKKPKKEPKAPPPPPSPPPAPIGATARQQAAAAKAAAYAKIRADEIARGEAKRKASPRAGVAPKRKAPSPRSASPRAPEVEEAPPPQPPQPARRAPPRRAKEPPPPVKAEEPAPKRRPPRRPPARRDAAPRAPRSPPPPKPVVRRRRLWSSAESDDDDPLLPRRTPEMRRKDRRVAAGSAWVRGDLDPAAVDDFIAKARELGIGEEKALEELNDHNNDFENTLASFGTPPPDQTLSSAVDAFLAAAALLGGEAPAPPPKKKPKKPTSIDNARRRDWCDHDLHRFAEALLDTDRDCAQALKKLQKAPRGGHRTESAASFARCTVGDALDLYYGRFKGSPQYAAWKVRLNDQREAWKKREETIGRLPGARGFRLQAKPVDIEKPRPEWNPAGLADVEVVVETEARRLVSQTSKHGTRLQDETRKAERADRKAAHDAALAAREALGAQEPPPRSYTPPISPFVGPFDAATEEARRLIAYSRYDPAAPLEFACPCGCGDRVDNRGRATSHRRKWATRSCRERASRDPRLRDVFEQLPPNSADFNAPPPSVLGNYEPREDDLCVCLCGCGKSIDNRGRSASHRRKWASAACRQRAHAERARDARLGRRMSVCAPDDVINASRKGSVDHQRQPRRVLIHTGVMVARSFDGRVLAGDVIGRAAPRRDSVSGALVRAWRVKFTDPEGEDRTLELSASEIADLVLKGAAPEADQRLAEELEAAEAADASQPAHRRFRGVTRKWYGDAARYNAAFSLLGDRFSLGGYDSPVQAARAWDQVAWRAGRGDDLNVVKFHGPPPQPSHDQQRLLAQRLRDNVRVRNAPVDADAVAASVVPSSPLPKRPLEDGDTPSKKKARPSLNEETPTRLDSKDDIFSSDDESLKPPPPDDFLQKSPARLELEDSSDDDEPIGVQPPTPAARHDDAPLVPHPDPVNRVVTESPASSTRESPPEPVVFAPDATTPAVSPPPVEAPKPPPQLEKKIPDEPMPCLN